MQTAEFSPGGYRFIPGVFQYSGGVVASPGYRIMRIRFMTPIALAQGFRRIEALLSEFDRPTTAFCACELRYPAPFSEHSITPAFRNARRSWKVIFCGRSACPMVPSIWVGGTDRLGGDGRATL